MPVITLRPKGPFHIGQGMGIEQQSVYAYVPSDTLFSALVTAWMQMGKAEQLISPFVEGRPPFILSSAFPCLLTQEARSWRMIVRLLPLPMVELPVDAVLSPKDKKQLRWVSQGVFERLCSGQAFSRAEIEGNLLHNRTVWVLKQERDEVAQAWGCEDIDARVWWATSVVPRVAVDRVTNASALFHAGRVTFAQGVGLWFAAADMTGVKDPPGLDDVKIALDILADVGLGGLRSTGHGAFTWMWDDLSPSLFRKIGAEDDYAVTLSRYAPRDADEIAQSLQPSGASYKLVNVAGWCVDDALHPWRRKRVRMAVEGSVMGYRQGLRGKLVDVTPAGAPQAHFGKRAVYRYGYAFPVSVRKEAVWEAPHE